MYLYFLTISVIIAKAAEEHQRPEKASSDGSPVHDSGSQPALSNENWLDLSMDGASKKTCEYDDNVDAGVTTVFSCTSGTAEQSTLLTYIPLDLELEKQSVDRSRFPRLYLHSYVHERSVQITMYFIVNLYHSFLAMFGAELVFTRK